MRGNGQKLISGAEFIVTTLKFFYIDVEAEARLLQFIGFHRVLFRASLIYQNSFDVKGANREPPLIGETDVFLIEGKATFKLKINQKAKVTSEQHDKKNFRIRISPADYIHVRALTPVFKIMVRLDRAPKSKREAASALALLQVSATNKKLKMQAQETQEAREETQETQETQGRETQQETQDARETQQETHETQMLKKIREHDTLLKALQEQNPQLLDQIRELREEYMW